MKISILIPQEYSEDNYPGFFQKYEDIYKEFCRQGYDISITRYSADIRSIIRLRKIDELKNVNFIWLRCPGRRIWAFIIFFALFVKQKGIILEMPNPFRLYLNILKLQSLSSLVGFLEVLLSIALMPILRSKLCMAIEYANESWFISKILDFKHKGCVIGNPVPTDIIKAVRLTSYLAVKTELQLVAVANFNFWHGIDRLIEGIAQYAAEPDATPVKLILIGEFDGTLKEKLQKEASNLSINSNIFFLGQKKENEMLELICQSDIAIGPLAMHRIGHTVESSLKAGLYCGVGIPFISTANDPRFSENFAYRKKIPADDAPINLKEVINWYDSLDTKIISSEMHKYFQKKLKNELILSPVFSKLADCYELH